MKQNTHRISSLFVLFLYSSVVFFTQCSGTKNETQKNDSTQANQKLNIDKIVATARIEPETKIVNLSSEVSGVVKEVRVKSGDKVKKGDILLILNNDLEQAQVNQNQANVQVIRGSRADLEASLQNAKIKAENALKKYQRLKNAFEQNAETQQNVDNAETEYRTALKDIDKIQAQITNNGNQVQEGIERVSLASVQVDKKIIKAPSNGTILSIDIQPGSAIVALNPLAEFAPDGAIVAICEVDELFATEVKIGQKAFVRLVGKTETLATGEVVAVAPYLRKKSLFSDAGGDLEDRRVREVKIRLNSSPKLILGMRVEAVISTK
ncbi:MAG: biotin/lipoyl-binding protein [Cytophagales bacterium]|nr:MAG: biotin/lipoyl-binding protein [Cytophagales bacterium]